MQNLPGSYIISIDPGFDHLAILTMVFKIDAPNRQIYLQVLSSSVNDIGEPSENVVQLSIAVDECFKKNEIYSLPADRTMCLIEQGFLSYYHPPNNPYAFVSKVRLRLLESTLYNILTRAHRITTFFLPALDVRRYFNHGTGNHYGNKKESVKLTRKFLDNCEGDTESLKSFLLPSNSMEDNHLCDAFNQFVFFLMNNLQLEDYTLFAM